MNDVSRFGENSLLVLFDEFKYWVIELRMVEWLWNENYMAKVLEMD